MPRTSDIKGFNLEISQGHSTGTVEWDLTQGIGLYGMIMFPIGAVFGDLGKVEVIHPQAGVVGEYGKNCPIPPVGKIDVEGNAENAVEIPAGLKLRFTYTAVDENGRKLTLWVKYQRAS